MYKRMKEGVLKYMKEIAWFVMYCTVIYHFSPRNGKKMRETNFRH
jgi:hypothetical protein